MIMITMMITIIIIITYDSIWWFLLPLKETVALDSFQEQLLSDLIIILIMIIIISMMIMLIMMKMMKTNLPFVSSDRLPLW